MAQAITRRPFKTVRGMLNAVTKVIDRLVWSVDFSFSMERHHEEWVATISVPYSCIEHLQIDSYSPSINCQVLKIEDNELKIIFFTKA